MFQLAGISVYLHWTWFLVAYYEFQFRASAYEFRGWNIAEYLTLFGIVLLHEFGHSLACRQVGGRADRIVLWPLGGVAFVNPPARPGAWLWSIAAGPLVNLLLAPVFVGAYLLASFFGLAQANADAAHFVFAVMYINFGLLIFNMLPVYPLDGGQILQSLLWFAIGRARSLYVVSVIGVVVGAGAVVLAVIMADLWFGFVAAFIVLQSLNGFQHARMLSQISDAPRHRDAACPSCGSRPAVGNYWMCLKCHKPFDAIVHGAECPNCGTFHGTTACPECRQANPIENWFDRRARQDG